jgi:carbon monoxide dehydrogenase subunit G
MRIENEFEVSAPIDTVWAYLLDVEKVAPCMPGATLTEVVDDTTWKGKVAVKLGPISMSFAGTVKLQERDEGNHRVVLKADGREQRGKGAASALVTSVLHAVDGGTKVTMDADLTITGAAAQYGRGMIGDISNRLTKEFAECLRTNMGAAGAAGSTTPPAAPSAAPPADNPAPTPAPVPAATARPVKGLRLGLWALWRTVVRFFQRLFGKEKP